MITKKRKKSETMLMVERLGPSDRLVPMEPTRIMSRDEIDELLELDRKLSDVEPIIVEFLKNSR